MAPIGLCTSNQAILTEERTALLPILIPNSKIEATRTEVRVARDDEPPVLATVTEVVPEPVPVPARRETRRGLNELGRAMTRTTPAMK